MSSLRWNSEEVGERCNFNSINDHFQMDALHFDIPDHDQYLFSLPPEESFQHSSSPETYNASFIPMDQELIISNNHIKNIHDSFERPAKQIKTTNTVNSSPVAPKVTSSSHLISFGNASSQLIDQELMNKDELLSYEDLNQRFLDSNDVASGQGTKRSTNNNAVARSSNAPEHVIAERKRRERLTERFIALSAVVPGLKKLDKASVLGDAINYLKKLQERVDTLEEEVKKKKSEDSWIVSQNSSKPPAASSDSSSLCDENSASGYSNAEIGVRISDRNVLIRIHSEKQKGFIPKMLCEIEKLNLSIVSSSVLPFGDYAINITIVSQMEAEFCWTVEGLVRKLRSAFQ